MPRVTHFEIPADNPERALEFYKKVFGWEAQKWEGPMEYWLITTGKDEPGIDGGLVRRQECSTEAGTGTVNTVQVASVDEAVSAVEAAGGKIAMPKMAIPGVGWVAYAIDPEGNMFGMMQNDTDAK